MKSIRLVLGVLVFASIVGAQDGVYCMEEGLLVVEFESLDAEGDWALEEDVAGHTGDGFLRWTGPDHFGVPGHDAFAVEFEVPEAGLYDFRIRNHHDNPDSTESNDVWVRLDGGVWVKLFSSIKNKWTWASNHEFDHDDKPLAQYDLSAGQHRLEFSGRSFDFRMDRMHLFTPDHPDGTNASQPESKKVASNRRPVALPTLDPPAIPAGDNGGTVVILDARDSYDPEGAKLKYRWQVRGANFVGGTGPGSEVAKIRLRQDGVAQPVRLTVTDPEGASSSRAVTLDVEDGDAQVRGELIVWHPVEVGFQGPSTDENANDPNPFLDYRLSVTWTAPDGSERLVPGFYAGDGEGGSAGDRWLCRFAPDRPGIWSYRASFREGSNVAIKLSPQAGTPSHCDGVSGGVVVMGRKADAEGFLSRGLLEYAGEHYLKFREGGYFLKGGTNSPENLLGYAGFDDVVDNGGKGIVHRYEPHVQDWRPGDPEFSSNSSGVSGKGIVGAINYLSAQGVNSVYFLPMNLGGDAQDTSPFVADAPSSHNRRHYDLSRLWQWGLVLDHAQRRGVLLHVVLAETEAGNENWLDGGELGVERKLFFRELSARFGHAPALKWNLSEENDYTLQQLEEFAEYLREVDPYDHPIAVHTYPDDFTDYEHLVGSPLFDVTSIQYTPSLAGDQVEEWRARSADAGRPWVLDMDENGTAATGLSDSNAASMRKRTLYDVYFSGGQIEWYAGYHDLPLGGDVKLEDFRTRQPMWLSMRIAREFMEQYLPYWEMGPADDLVLDGQDQYGGPECLAKPGEVYAIYLPKGNNLAKIDLRDVPASARFIQRWFNPRTGGFDGDRRLIEGGEIEPLMGPPGQTTADWVVLITLRD
jgi:hypothetical protein